MDHFSAQQFPTSNANPSINPIERRTPLSSSGMTSFAQRDKGGYPQNVNITDNSGPHATPEPSSDLYNQNLQIQNVHSLRRLNQSPLYHIQTSQSSLAYAMPNNVESQRLAPLPPKENIYKANRNNRLQVLRRRSSAPSSVPKGIIRERRFFPNRWSNPNITVNENRNTNVYTSDGKRLQEILTKVLQLSDISNLSRIVLPKRDAEMNLPTLTSNVGIDLQFKDVSSDDILWVFKYKFWINNKSRMYLLENTGAFVKHYGLQTGDSIIIYRDEAKNLYAGLKKKEREDEEVSGAAPNIEMPENNNSSDTMVPLSPSPQDKVMEKQQPEACLPLSTEEHNNKDAEEAASSNTFIPSNGGASPSVTVAQLDQLPNAEEGTPSQAAAAAVATAVDGQTRMSDKEQQERLDEFFATIDEDVSQPGFNYVRHGNDDHGFNYLTGFDIFP